MATRTPPASASRHPLHRRTSKSRRRWLRRLLGFGLALPFLAAAAAMVRRVQAADVPADVTIPPDVPVGLSVVESIIVQRDSGGVVRAYSARCTHLGCRIDRVVADEAVCPCHGSRYRPDGSVAAGPATRPLKALRVEPDAATGGWIARAT